MNQDLSILTIMFALRCFDDYRMPIACRNYSVNMTDFIADACQHFLLSRLMIPQWHPIFGARTSFADDAVSGCQRQVGPADKWARQSGEIFGILFAFLVAWWAVSLVVLPLVLRHQSRLMVVEQLSCPSTLE